MKNTQRSHFSICRIFLVLLAILAFEFSNAQSKEISGTVTGSDGVLLPGVTVLIKSDQTKGAQTDFDGKYFIEVPNPETTLIFSSIGFVTKEIIVANQTVIDVSLELDTQSLEEIVLIGYGSQRKKDLTGSIATIDAEGIQNNAQTSVDQMLQGRVAGVQVSQTSGQPGGGVSIRIRGNASLNTSNEPLYVIDGIPVSNSPSINSNGANIPGSTAPNPLNGINPKDIESIQVLKDASATAIYGSRGANGVIIIATKSGKSGRLKIDYGTSTGFQKIAKTLDLLNGSQYVDHVGDILGQQGSELLPELSNTSINTDWQDEIYETAIIQQHNLSLSGGNNENKFYTSMNYTNQDGILKGSGFERYAGRLKWGYRKNKFTADVNISTSLTIDDITAHGGGGNFDSGAISTAVYLPATAPIFNANGSYFQPDVIDLDNPYNLIEGISIKGKEYRTLASIKGSYEVLENLKASLAISTDVKDAKRESYRSRQTVVGSQAGGIANILTAKETNYVIEGLLDYNNTFDDHTISALGGYTYQQFENQAFNGDARGFIGDEVGTNNIGSGNQEFNDLFSKKERNSLLSYLSRVNYTFKDKFLVTGSLRADGSSRLADGNKYSLFPSFSLGYRISEESFMQSVDFVNALKVRLGWGQIGNVQIPNSASVTTFIAGNSAVFNDEPIVGLQPARIANPDLEWERTEQINFGVDFGVLDNRISGSIDIYNKKTKDLLFQKPVPLQTGFATQWVNLSNSEITNSGMEAVLNTTNTTGKFEWKSSFNITFNKSEISELDGERIINNNPALATIANLEGEAPFSYYGYEHIGIWQTGENPAGSAQPDAVPGQPKWKDQNNDGIIDAEDRTVLGDPYPDFTWGVSNVFSYKNFDLSIFIEGVQGVDLFNVQLANTYSPFNESRNRFADPIINRWTESNPTNEWPSFVNPSSYGGDLTNTFTIQDASFIRLKNVTLNYTFNLKKNKFIRNLNVYVSGQNLAILTDYIGYDPDLSGTNNSKFDFNSYPTSKTFLMGLNIGF